MQYHIPRTWPFWVCFEIQWSTLSAYLSLSYFYVSSKVLLIKPCGGLFFYELWDLGLFGPLFVLFITILSSIYFRPKKKDKIDLLRCILFSVISFQCFEITNLCRTKYTYIYTMTLFNPFALMKVREMSIYIFVEKSLDQVFP